MKHLLFLPAPEHRDALLGEGVGGSRPPVAVLCPARHEQHELDTDAHGFVCLECQEDWPCGQPNRELQPARWEQAAGWEWERKGVGRSAYPFEGALILVWNGVIAAEGCDRLVRVWNADRRTRGLRSVHCMYEWVVGMIQSGDAQLLPEAVVLAGLGTTNEVTEEAP